MGIVMIMRIVLIVWMAHAIAYGSATRQKLTACLRVKAVERRLISPQAQELAAKMFAGVGISLEWRACEPASESSQERIVVELALGTPKDFKSGVLGYATPHYSIVGSLGPDHQRVFQAEVSVERVHLALGTGSTIKAAHQAAAREALERLPQLLEAIRV